MAFDDVSNAKRCRRTVGIYWIPRGKDCHSDWQIEDKHTVFPANKHAVQSLLLLWVSCLFIMGVFVFCMHTNTISHLFWHIAGEATPHTWGRAAIQKFQTDLLVWSLSLGCDRWGPATPWESWERPVCLLCTFSWVSLTAWFILCWLAPWTSYLEPGLTYIAHSIFKRPMHFNEEKKIGSRSDS